MKKFYFTWYEKKSKIERHNIITISNPKNKISKDAKAAVDVFTSTFGNLKKNEIITIQELDDNNNPVGEPIKPLEDTSIVPTAK